MRRSVIITQLALLLAAVVLSSNGAAQTPATAPAPTSSGPVIVYMQAPTAAPAATAPPPQPAPAAPAPAPAAPPPAAPAAPPLPYSSQPADPGERATHSIKLEAGFGLRWLDGVSFRGMDYRGAVGSENDHVGHYATGGFVWGETSEHLRTYAATFGYNIDIRPAEAFRLGLGIEGTYLWVRRASVDSRMWALGGGGFVHASYDLVPLGRRAHNALYVDLRLSGTIHYGDVFFWGPTISVGFRF